jgi:hypothetical protein
MERALCAVEKEAHGPNLSGLGGHRTGKKSPQAANRKEQAA